MVSTERLLTPSKITAWLDCSHYLTLLELQDSGSLTPTNAGIGSFARLLMDKGLQHEHAYLDKLKADGRDVYEVPERQKGGESFAQWTERVSHVLAEGHDVVYQMPFVHDGLRGVADFLVKTPGQSALGDFYYEPVDAKLTRAEAKPGHVLQLCFYADALQAVQGVTPEQVHLYLGSGRTESIRVADVGAYWRRIRHQLHKLMQSEHESDTEPVKCKHCDFCEFADHCKAEWVASDSLQFVAGIRTSELTELMAGGVDTMQKLADAKPATAGLRPERVEVLHRQAALQKLAVDTQPPPFEAVDITVSTDEATVRRGRLPKPDDGDVFLDYEGHPFWTPARGLFFMFGLLFRDASSAWAYEAWWAHDEHEEKANTAKLIDWIAERRKQFPSCHIYHYNHTERSSLERLAAEYGTGELLLNDLVEAGVFVDVLDVVRQRVRVGAESYSLKVLELVADYERSHEIDAGSGAVVDYDAWCTDADPERLDRIARYNEDDVRATMAVRDWLLRHPLNGEPYRPELTLADEEGAAVDEVVAGLMETGEEWKILLAHLLTYWDREGAAHWAQHVPLLDADAADQLKHPQVISGLTFVRTRPHEGQQRDDRAVFKFPVQTLSADIVSGKNKAFMYPTGEGGAITVTADSVDPSPADSVDPSTGELVVGWHQTAASAPLPTAVVVNDWVNPRPKPSALATYATRVLEDKELESDAVRRALLQRETPKFAVDAGPPGGVFDSTLAETVKVAPCLDHSYLAVQGPPGTGKTYTGSHVIEHLLECGKRVGVTAFSHAAINNLVKAVIEVRPGTNVLRQGPAPTDPANRLPNTTYNGDGDKWAKGGYDLLAGTSWMFSNDKAIGAVDVLVIDEAGQMGLADALAAMSSCDNVILLGDPLQLAQVSLASHPGGADASTLEHALGEHATIPPQRGVFLDTTWRMHPDVSSFLSTQIYDGRLVSHPNCANQSVDGEAGLRWLAAVHDGCDTRSGVEARLVADTIQSLVGKTWVDFDGAERQLTAADVMVVAPYNDHVDLVRFTLNQDALTRDARVGTVDKFQGQEAPVVIFTMATSSGEYMPRTADFLFSRNRLNVAISRARALAYVVCTEALLDTRAKTVDQMKLIGTLCAFVEAATSTSAP